MLSITKLFFVIWTFITDIYENRIQYCVKGAYVGCLIRTGNFHLTLLLIVPRNNDGKKNDPINEVDLASSGTHSLKSCLGLSSRTFEMQAEIMFQSSAIKKLFQ